MLSVYLAPIILRPLDCLFNFRGYVIGMFTYILMLPTFITIMQIYSMSNLHDISWGNRPTAGTTGTNMLSNNAAKQKQLKDNYAMFRVNFVTAWALANVVYVMAISSFGGGDPRTKNDGHIGLLEVFAAYLAGMVVYRFIFGGLHILRFKYRAWAFAPKYGVKKVNLKKQYHGWRGFDEHDVSVSDADVSVRVSRSRKASVRSHKAATAREAAVG